MFFLCFSFINIIHGSERERREGSTFSFSFYFLEVFLESRAHTLFSSTLFRSFQDNFIRGLASSPFSRSVTLVTSLSFPSTHVFFLFFFSFCFLFRNTFHEVQPRATVALIVAPEKVPRKEKNNRKKRRKKSSGNLRGAKRARKRRSIRVDI